MRMFYGFGDVIPYPYNDQNKIWRHCIFINSTCVPYGAIAQVTAIPTDYALHILLVNDNIYYNQSDELQ